MLKQFPGTLASRTMALAQNWAMFSFVETKEVNFKGRELYSVYYGGECEIDHFSSQYPTTLNANSLGHNRSFFEFWRPRNSDAEAR